MAPGAVPRAALRSACEPLLERCTFPPPDAPVVAAVSGGPDSLALLALAVAAGLEVTAVHVDHGLRPGSAAELDVVAAAAEQLGAGVRGVAVDVAPGPDLEARARIARHAALGPHAMFGHTADDQAETVLGNLLRGAGLAGAAGMAPGHRHPILALRRGETEALCAELGLEVVRDPSNDDPAFRRNRLRHEVLPLLDDVAGRDVVPLLARHAAHARAATEHLAAEAAAAVPDPTDARAVAAAPGLLAAIAVQGWLRACSDERHPPDAAAVGRVLAVARGEALATELAGGWRVTRSAQRLHLHPPPGAAGRAQPPV